MRKRFLIKGISIIILFCILVIFFYSFCCKKESKLHTQIYENLIEKIIPSNDKEGIYNDISKIKEKSKSPSFQEIAYLISAESNRYKSTHEEKSELIISEGINYLLNCSDLDMDGEPGYGLFFAWDAFGDGSVNDEYTSYAITNAAVINAFLDALETAVSIDDKRIKEVISRITVTWCEKYFEETAKGGYFWYSNKESDAIDCPNISAVLGGGIARAVSEYPEIFSVEEEKDIRAKIKMIQLGLIEEVKIVSGCTFWNYINGKEGGNDLVHQCFILEGIMQMRQYGDTCEYPWPEGNESKSVDSYKKEDTIYSYSLLQQESEIASLYDLGGMLQYYSDTGAKNDANDVFRFALKTYGDIQDQDAKIEDIREMIFFLKGLSVFSYG